MSYAVKEIYYTLQGEGMQTGRPAVFCRFAGCNLWSGREEDRAEAICSFCDTDFVGMDGPYGGKYRTAAALADVVETCWISTSPEAAGRIVVCTGGEPLLQLDTHLVEAFHKRGFEVAVESNGTIAAPAGIDWLCVSPKAGADLVQRSGDELKLVYPQADAPPEAFLELDFRYFLLQPMDGPHREANTGRAVEYCLANPRWRLSLQTHKFLGLP